MKSFQKVDAFISISNYIKKELQCVGVDSKKIYTIYNIPFSIYDSFMNPCGSLQKNGKSGIICLAAGRLTPEKGFDVAIHAIGLAKDHLEGDLKLIIAGAGPELGKLQKMVELMGLQSQVIFTGWVSQSRLAELYAYSDVFLMCSIYPEPFGRGTIDAMSFGKPIIASDIGGLPEAVITGINGVLVTANSPQELSNVIVQLANDKLLREKLGSAGKELLAERFSPTLIVSKTIQLYEQLMRERT